MTDAIRSQHTGLPAGRFRTFEEMQTIILEFEQTLRSVGVEVAPGSRLENACLAGLQMFMVRSKEVSQSPTHDIRPDVVDVCGLWQFAERVNRLRGTPLMDQLQPHLALMSQGDFAQNRTSERHDQASNKLFELLIGLAAADMGANTELDDPNRSTGTNPDVLTTIASRRWGFACKTMHSSSPKTIYDRIDEGVGQIEAATGADTGLVVISLKNLIDHHAFFPVLNESDYRAGQEPVFGVFKEHSAVSRALTAQVDKIREGVLNTIGTKEFASTFAGKKAVAGVAFVSQTVIGVASQLGPIPSLITVLSIMPVGSLTSEQSLVLNALNLSLHDRLIIRAPGM